MKRILCVIAGLLVLAAAAWASAREVQAAPALMVNATYVYVTSYDGPEFSPDLWPADRRAIADVERALQAQGRYIVVYNPKEADLVIMVQSRPSEDVLAVYDATLWPDASPLWREMERGGLQPHELPLVTKLEKAVNLTAQKLGMGRG